MKHWRLIAKQPLLILGIHQVDHPFSKEGGHILIIATSADEDLSVASPAQAFVTLRTIGWHFQVVGTLPPQDVAMQLIQHRIRTLKGSRYGRIRMHHNPSDRIRCGLSSQPADLHITKSVKGKTRLPNLFGAAL